MTLRAISPFRARAEFVGVVLAIASLRGAGEAEQPSSRQRRGLAEAPGNAAGAEADKYWPQWRGPQATGASAHNDSATTTHEPSRFDSTTLARAWQNSLVTSP